MWSLHLETGGAPGAGMEEVSPARSSHSLADVTEPQPKLGTGRAKSLPISLWLWSHQHTDTRELPLIFCLPNNLTNTKFSVNLNVF